MKKHVVVIGGGLAGTSAAYALTKRGYEVTIIEKDGRLGGRIHTHVVEGAAMEMGACFLTKEYKNLLAFLVETKLDGGLYRQRGRAGILKHGTIRLATLKTLIGNGTLSWRTKLQLIHLTLRALRGWRQFEFHNPWGADAYDDRSVADMFSKPSQKELLEYLMQPALNGYLYWTPEHTSQATLLIIWRTAIAQGLGKYKLRGGLQRVPVKAAEGSNVLLGCAVSQATLTSDGGYDIAVTNEAGTQTLHADGIVCATTASAVPFIFPNLNDRQRAFFTAVEYSSTALVTRIYKPEQTRGDIGIAFPRLEGTGLSAATLSPELGPEPAAGTIAVAKLNTYASGAIGKELCSLSDEAIIKRLSSEMQPVQDVFLVGDPKPLITYVQRWPEALPFFDVGHLKRLRSFEDGEIEDQSQAVTFAGDYIGGPCMESAFTSGMQAAERLDLRLIG